MLKLGVLLAGFPLYLSLCLLAGTKGLWGAGGAKTIKNGLSTFFWRLMNLTEKSFWKCQLKCFLDLLEYVFFTKWRENKNSHYNIRQVVGFGGMAIFSLSPIHWQWIIVVFRVSYQSCPRVPTRGNVTHTACLSWTILNMEKWKNVLKTWATEFTYVNIFWTVLWINSEDYFCWEWIFLTFEILHLIIYIKPRTTKQNRYLLQTSFELRS